MLDPFILPGLVALIVFFTVAMAWANGRNPPD